MNKTILLKVGVSDSTVEGWLKKGLRITYPMVKNDHYYKSEDGVPFIENGDKYLIPLSREELNVYTNNPENFRKDFLTNCRFYVTFVNWIYQLTPKTNSLRDQDKFASLLVLLYLFQRSMDYHYYHFDRYLAYQNYPNTPVGYWWSKLKFFADKMAKINNIDSNEVFLKLLSNDQTLIRQNDTIFSKSGYSKLQVTLQNIKIFEEAQEAEVKIVTDIHARENIFFRTAIPLWSAIVQLLKKNNDLMKPQYHSKISTIIEGHPLVMTRVILSPVGLSYFQPGITELVTKEVMRWTSKD